MIDAFKQLFAESEPRLPRKIQTDKGNEFLNKQVQDLFRQKQIHHFCTESNLKAAVVERLNRTLKTKVKKSFTALQNEKYIDKLDQFVNAYNNSYHRSIGMAPSQVQKKYENKIWVKLYGHGVAITNSKFNQNDRVRVSKLKGTFEKGYTPNWSGEHFYIDGEVAHPKKVFKLRDYAGVEVKGTWYPEEIQKIGKTEHLIEKILGRRKGTAKK